MSGVLPYNGTAPDGGNSRTNLAFVPQLNSVTFNLNQWYTTGDLAWTITASAFVWLMIPGVGFFYSGLSGQKSALSLIMLSFISLSVVTFQVCIPIVRYLTSVVPRGLLTSFLSHRE